MATVHFENGKYHVHKDVLKNVKEENNSNTNRSSKKDNAAVEYFLPLNKYLSSEIKQGSAFYSTIPIPSVIEGIYTYNYPPPRI